MDNDVVEVFIIFIIFIVVPVLLLLFVSLFFRFRLQSRITHNTQYRPVLLYGSLVLS